MANLVPQILDGVQHVPRERVQNLVREADRGCASATGRLQRSSRQATARVDVHKLSRSWMYPGADC